MKMCKSTLKRGEWRGDANAREKNEIHRKKDRKKYEDTYVYVYLEYYAAKCFNKISSFSNVY